MDRLTQLALSLAIILTSLCHSDTVLAHMALTNQLSLRAFDTRPRETHESVQSSGGDGRLFDAAVRNACRRSGNGHNVAAQGADHSRKDVVDEARGLTCGQP